MDWRRASLASARLRRSSASMVVLVSAPVASGSLHSGQRFAKPGLSGLSSNSSEQTAQVLMGKGMVGLWRSVRAVGMLCVDGDGAPETIRTSDLQLRRLLLYPAELRARSVLSLAWRAGFCEGAGFDRGWWAEEHGDADRVCALS